MSIVERFVEKYGRVRRSDCNPNPLISTTYSFGDELTCYSPIGQHSEACQEWMDENQVTPWEELNESERAILTWYVMASINPDFPAEVPYEDLVKNYENL